jgi:hypothetical protein
MSAMTHGDSRAVDVAEPVPMGAMSDLQGRNHPFLSGPGLFLARISVFLSTIQHGWLEMKV